MDGFVLFGVLLGLVWGIFWAVFLEATELGQFLATRRTWITVVVGVGVDLLVMAIVLPFEQWLFVCGVVAASGVGLIVRSLYNEWGEAKAFRAALLGDDGEQDETG